MDSNRWAGASVIAYNQERIYGLRKCHQFISPWNCRIEVIANPDFSLVFRYGSPILGVLVSSPSEIPGGSKVRTVKPVAVSPT